MRLFLLPRFLLPTKSSLARVRRSLPRSDSAQYGDPDTGVQNILRFFPVTGFLHDEMPDITGHITPFPRRFVHQHVGHIRRQINGDSHATVIADFKQAAPILAVGGVSCYTVSLPAGVYKRQKENLNSCKNPFRNPFRNPF